MSATAPAIRRRSRPLSRRAGDGALHLALAIGALFWIAPVFLLVVTSLKTAAEFAHGDTFALPETIHWNNFARAWAAGVHTYFVNSLIMTVIKVPVGVLIAALASFAMVFMKLFTPAFIAP